MLCMSKRSIHVNLYGKVLVQMVEFLRIRYFLFCLFVERRGQTVFLQSLFYATHLHLDRNYLMKCYICVILYTHHIQIEYTNLFPQLFA